MGEFSGTFEPGTAAYIDALAAATVYNPDSGGLVYDREGSQQDRNRLNVTRHRVYQEHRLEDTDQILRNAAQFVLDLKKATAAITIEDFNGQT